MVFKQLLKRLSTRSADPLSLAGIAPGLYPYHREAGGTYTRFHLRVDSSGSGLLLANATAAAWLAASGVIIAKAILEGDSDDTIFQRLDDCFRDVTRQTVTEDVRCVREAIDALDSPGDNYPIVNLADPSFTPQTVRLDRPLSADVPLAQPERLVPILDRMWDLGIPHVTILAGKDPDPAGLVRAVERAEDLGLIAGVRARASDLVQGSLIKDLAMAGVDHIDVLYLSAQPEVHDALGGAGDHRNAVAALAQIRDNEVCPVADVALVDATTQTIEDTLEGLGTEGITNVAFYAIAVADAPASHPALTRNDLVQAAELIEETADEWQVRYLWYPPVRFDPGKTLAEQVCRGPRCSGDHAVRVEPDGRVILARGPYRPAGNLLTDDWSAIRQQDAFHRYRQRVETDTHCDQCPGLAICAADCPRDPAGWAEGWGEDQDRRQ
jgi:radical SAM protein with 4Fe4S-binding SPASM domain